MAQFRQGSWPTITLELIDLLFAIILKQSMIIHEDDAWFPHASTTIICHVAHHQSTVTARGDIDVEHPQGHS